MAIDMSLAGTTAPPRKTRSATATTKATVVVVKDKNAERQEAIAGVFSMAQFGLTVGGLHADAGAIGLHGDPIAKEMADLAATNEKIAASIDKLMMMGPYAGLITATLPLVVQLMVNHKAIKLQGITLPGVMAPEALAAQSQIAFARQAKAALEMQQQAESELAAIQAQMQAQSNGSNHVPASDDVWQAGQGQNPRSDL